MRFRSNRDLPRAAGLGEGRHTNDVATIDFDIASQISKGAAEPDMIVNEKIAASCDNRPGALANRTMVL